MKARYILMADIIGSKDVGKVAYREFKQSIEQINEFHEKRLLSPLTVTLGDEFQGIAKNRSGGIELIFAIEEAMLLSGIRLRYVLEEGIVETKINPDHAHGMVGPGLTKARKDLEELKKTDDRFAFDLKDKGLTSKLNLAFRLYKSIVDDWHIRDGDASLANDFLELGDYKLVAERHHKDSSSMWRKEKSLKIREYLAIKDLVFLLIGVKIAP